MSLGKQSKAQVAAVRETVFDRDGGCVVHGTLWDLLKPCGGVMTVQHRVGRGMGGSAKYDTAEHLVAMCSVHNQLETSWPEFAKACVRNGWSIPRWAADLGVKPSEVPVLAEQEWFLLHETHRVHIPSQLAEETILGFYGTEYED